MRIITVGPLPPEWGGPRPGGVATSHRLVLEGLRKDHDLAVISWTQSEQVDILRPNKSDPESWYEEQASRADVVLMAHVSHPWAIYHARRRPTAAVGSVHSWSPVLKDAEKRLATIEGMSGMDVLVFPSVHCREQGLDLGFSYPVPTMIVRNALSRVFLSNVDLDQRRHGVVFAGSSSVPIKRLEVAEEACRRLGLDLRVISGRPHRDVQSQRCCRPRRFACPASPRASGTCTSKLQPVGHPRLATGQQSMKFPGTWGFPLGTARIPTQPKR